MKPAWWNQVSNIVIQFFVSQVLYRIKFFDLN